MEALYTKKYMLFLSVLTELKLEYSSQVEFESYFGSMSGNIIQTSPEKSAQQVILSSLLGILSSSLARMLLGQDKPCQT